MRKQAQAIAAIDLCVVPTVSFDRLFAFLVLGHGRRQLLWFAVTRQLLAAFAGIISLPFVMVVNPSVSAKTVPELIAYVQANPGKMSFASPGIGTPGHELFKMMAGIDLVHVPYRG